MKFKPEAIDLIKTYKAFRKEHPLKSKGSRSSVCRTRFGLNVVRMADAAIGTHIEESSVKGVKACIEYEIRQIPAFTAIPFLNGNRKLFSIYDGHAVGCLADSLILTTVAYRIQLNERHSNLAHIVFNELLQGFEWACWWQYHGLLDPSKNSAIEIIDVEEVRKFLR